MSIFMGGQVFKQQNGRMSGRGFPSIAFRGLLGLGHLLGIAEFFGASDGKGCPLPLKRRLQGDESMTLDDDDDGDSIQIGKCYRDTYTWIVHDNYLHCDGLLAISTRSSMGILKYTEHAGLDKDGKEGDFFDGSLNQISGMYFLLVSLSPLLSFFPIWTLG